MVKYLSLLCTKYKLVYTTPVTGNVLSVLCTLYTVNCSYYSLLITFNVSADILKSLSDVIMM